MKTTHSKIIGFYLTFFLLYSCQNAWEEHYLPEAVSSEKMEVFQGDAMSFIQSSKDLSLLSGLMESYGISSGIAPDGGYTFIVYSDAVMQNRPAGNDSLLVLNCVSDLALPPSRLKEGFGIYTRLGKNIWVYERDSCLYLDEVKISRSVKVDNGYVYYVEGLIPIRQSIYDYLKQLGPDYSRFVALVERFEERYFDKEKSIPIGIDPMGNTTYDTVWSVRNTLMDRYTAEGLKYWDMRSEDFVSTMFIPSNDLIDQAIQAALDSIPIWLARDTTAADRAKFERWIVRACFADRRLSDEEVSPQAPAFDCVGAHQLIIDQSQDVMKYQRIEPARWNPAIQTADFSSPVALSNGKAYYLNHLKIPNHVVIYRVKAKFYELWGAMTDEQKEQYFRWTNWVEPLIVNDTQSEFTLTETMPTMYYHVLTAIPSEEAIADSLVCSVNYDGLLYNSKTRKLTEVHLPAGEYYLRMGFKHSLRYCISIYFNDELLVEDMLLFAQGSNFHFDRGSVSDMDYFGSSTIGFPEGYSWRDWIEKNEKAVAYDTDGYQVAIVNLPHSGNFTITIESNDNSYLYTTVNGRSKNNVTQLMMYHWCLRPTTNNY
ncbi:MAG: hypothetical protein GXY66_10155 [Bacteroidales bacterium]|nr:hypothetical protein [Bacteroidales bacterium]